MTERIPEDAKAFLSRGRIRTVYFPGSNSGDAWLEAFYSEHPHFENITELEKALAAYDREHGAATGFAGVRNAPCEDENPRYVLAYIMKGGRYHHGPLKFVVEESRKTEPRT